jgi:Fe-S cluster biosynthesis and repair protein YggX
VKESDAREVKRMANESCDPALAPSETVKPGTRMVHCVKFDKELPGLDRIPWQGELGKRVYENVSKDAWKLWLEYSKMVMNEYRLNPLDANSQKIMGEQMEQFFFGEGAKLPEGYVPPKAKG